MERYRVMALNSNNFIERILMMRRYVTINVDDIGSPMFHLTVYGDRDPEFRQRMLYRTVCEDLNEVFEEIKEGVFQLSQPYD